MCQKLAPSAAAPAANAIDEIVFTDDLLHGPTSGINGPLIFVRFILIAG
jgi:hypothetical protein